MGNCLCDAAEPAQQLFVLVTLGKVAEQQARQLVDTELLLSGEVNLLIA